MMTAEEINRRLKVERIVQMTAEDWAAVAGDYEELERRATLVAGDLLIVRGAEGLAAVEHPSPQERVLRRLDGEEEARRFVEERLSQYERMWDGCGCKVDYYK